MADVIVLKAIRDNPGLKKAYVTVSGGTARSPDIFRFFHAIGVKLRNLYGTTETGVLTQHLGNYFARETMGKWFRSHPDFGSPLEWKLKESGELLARGAILDRIMVKGGLRETLEDTEINGIRRIAFIIVDAETSSIPSWKVGDIPGLSTVLDVSSTVMVNKYNFEMLDMLRRSVKDWQTEDAARRKLLVFYIVHITFDSLPKKRDRDYFHSIPTTFSLSTEQVDRLREVAAKLLLASPDFKRFVVDMGGKIPEPPQ